MQAWDDKKAQIVQEHLECDISDVCATAVGKLSMAFSERLAAIGRPQIAVPTQATAQPGMFNKAKDGVKSLFRKLI